MRRRSKWAVWVAAAVILAAAVPGVAGVGSFGVDGKPPTKGFVAVEAYKWLRDSAAGVIRGCDRDTDRFDDLRAVGVSEFKRQAVNCLASVGFFDGWPAVAGVGSFGVDGKPPTKGFVAVEAYKWLRDSAAGVIRGCDRDTDRFDDLRAVGVSEFKRQAVNCLASVGFFDGWPAVDASGLSVCVFGDRSDRVRDAVWQVSTDGGIGTAFYIGDGEWLTAEHVVEGYGEVTLAWGGVELVATVEAVDADVDLGLLTGAEPSGVQPLRLGDVTSVTAGSDVYVVGYPLYADRSAAVSRGVLSRIERWTVEDNDHWTSTNMVVTDAAANPGNSGGPLVDSCGRVIGVITSKQVDVSVEGLAYAVSDVTVRPFLVLARAGELDKGGSGSRVESNPGGNGSGNDDGAYRSDGWQWHEGENRSGTYVGARTWVKVDEDDWFIVGIRCTAREDLDVYFYRSSADMGEHERGYVEWRFGDQQNPVGYWGSVSTTGKAVFLNDDDGSVFIDDLRSDGSGWLYATMWGYDSNGGYDWQGEGKLSVVGASVVNDVIETCGQTGGGNRSGNDDGAQRSDGWQWHEGENRSGTYVGARTWVKVDEDDWFIVGIRCTAREDLDVYFYRSSADMGEHERGYVEWRFGDQQNPVGNWGNMSTNGKAVFLDDDGSVFIDDLWSDGSGWLYAAMWGYDSNGGYDWQGEGKLSVVGAPVVNDVLETCS